MGLLQRVFNISNGVVGALDPHIKKNEDKFWDRANRASDGKGLVTKAGGFVSIFAPATYLFMAQDALKAPFYAARSVTMKRAAKTDRPLDTAKLSKKLPRRSDRWTE
jgi:hypothetical protein